jgi:hypothetical protein
VNPSSAKETHPSELELHALALGGLPAERVSALEHHTRDCARCREALEALGQAHGEFKRSVLPRTLPGIQARAGRPSALRWIFAGVPLAAAAGALVLLLAPSRGPEPVPDVLPKGGGALPAVAPGLELFVQRDGAVSKVAPDAGRLRPGDQVRFVARRPPGMRYVLVVSADAGGGTSVYYPFGGTESAALEGAPARTEIPGSIVLDDSPGPERIFALYSSRPLAVSTLRGALEGVARGGPAAVRSTERLTLEGAGQASFLFEKDPRP